MFKMMASNPKRGPSGQQILPLPGMPFVCVLSVTPQRRLRLWADWSSGPVLRADRWLPCPFPGGPCVRQQQPVVLQLRGPRV